MSEEYATVSVALHEETLARIDAQCSTDDQHALDRERVVSELLEEWLQKRD